MGSLNSCCAACCTYLVQAHDLPVRLLDLLQLGEEVPETGLGNDIVRGEDAHAVELRGGLAVGGQMAPNDLVLLQATCWANRISAVLRKASHVLRSV